MALKISLMHPYFVELVFFFFFLEAKLLGPISMDIRFVLQSKETVDPQNNKIACFSKDKVVKKSTAE